MSLPIWLSFDVKVFVFVRASLPSDETNVGVFAHRRDKRKSHKSLPTHITGCRRLVETASCPRLSVENCRRKRQRPVLDRPLLLALVSLLSGVGTLAVLRRS